MSEEPLLSLTERLEDLLAASPPAALRKSLLRVYLQYLIDHHESLPADFESIACDFQLLVQFLDEMEKNG